MRLWYSSTSALELISATYNHIRALPAIIATVRALPAITDTISPPDYSAGFGEATPTPNLTPNPTPTSNLNPNPNPNPPISPLDSGGGSTEAALGNGVGSNSVGSNGVALQHMTRDGWDFLPGDPVAKD